MVPLIAVEELLHTVAQDCAVRGNVSSEDYFVQEGTKSLFSKFRWSNPTVQDVGVKMTNTIHAQFNSQ